MKRIPKPKPESYIFVEDYKKNGTTICSGVELRGQFKISSGEDGGSQFITWNNVQGGILKDIPLDKLKKIETIKLKKPRKVKLEADKKRIVKKGEKTKPKTL